MIAGYELMAWWYLPVQHGSFMLRLTAEQLKAKILRKIFDTGNDWADAIGFSFCALSATENIAAAHMPRYVVAFVKLQDAVVIYQSP